MELFNIEFFVHVSATDSIMINRNIWINDYLDDISLWIMEFFVILLEVNITHEFITGDYIIQPAGW